MRILFNERQGKECRACGTRPRVIDTRPTDTGFVYRRSQCECGQGRTLEIPMSLYEDLQQQIEDLKKQRGYLIRELNRTADEAKSAEQAPKETLLIDEPKPRLPPPRHVIDSRSMSI